MPRAANIRVIDHARTKIGTKSIGHSALRHCVDREHELTDRALSILNSFGKSMPRSAIRARNHPERLSEWLGERRQCLGAPAIPEPEAVLQGSRETHAPVLLLVFHDDRSRGEFEDGDIEIAADSVPFS